MALNFRFRGGTAAQRTASGPAVLAAREIAVTLERQGLLRPAGEGDYRFACSGDPTEFRAIGSRFLQMPFGDVEQVDPGFIDGA